MQNLDWSEDCVYHGLECESEENPDYNKALDFYNNAIELDPLNI
jgi:hypothetical protein